MELFLPGMVVSAENQGTFSDYHYDHGLIYGVCNGSSFVSGMSDVSLGIKPGVFIDIDIEYESAWHDLGSRLSKN